MTMSLEGVLHDLTSEALPAHSMYVGLPPKEKDIGPRESYKVHYQHPGTKV